MSSVIATENGLKQIPYKAVVMVKWECTCEMCLAFSQFWANHSHRSCDSCVPATISIPHCLGNECGATPWMDGQQFPSFPSHFRPFPVSWETEPSVSLIFWLLSAVNRVFRVSWLRNSAVVQCSSRRLPSAPDRWVVSQSRAIVPLQPIEITSECFSWADRLQSSGGVCVGGASNARQSHGSDRNFSMHERKVLLGELVFVEMPRVPWIAQWLHSPGFRESEGGEGQEHMRQKGSIHMGQQSTHLHAPGVKGSRAI